MIDLHAEFGITLQPYIVVVGPTLSSIQEIHVMVDEIKYEVQSFFKAVDLCFKCFHFFNAKYPKQSEPVWLLLQKALYQLKTKWDRKITKVTTAIKHLSEIRF